jgi:type II secretory ATPase GspE/PulE/Tfp pilus assembly ATPase PilB-like protein
VYVGTKEEYEEIRQGYGPEHWDKLGIPQDVTFRLTRGKGCETCNRSGFKGRVALHELLLGSDRMKRLIQTKAKTEEMVKAAIEDGMTTLMQDGIQKCLQGHTTFKEVKAVAIK